MEVAWIYRSGDKPGNVQVNPIIVGGVMYAPTSGNHVVAVNGATGQEIWRYAPSGKTSRRGIAYWRDPSGEKDRIKYMRRILASVTPGNRRMLAAVAKLLSSIR